MRRGAWGIGVAVVVLGAAGVALPAPVAAAGAAAVAVTGTLTLSGPVNPACSSGSPCPPSVILTPPPTGKQSPPYTVVGPLRSASFSSGACVGAGACSVVASGSFHGYCDFASGRLSAGVTDGLGGVHLLDITYEVVGRSLVGRGHATRPNNPEVGDAFVTGEVTGGCAPGTTSLSLAAQVAIAYPKLTL